MYDSNIHFLDFFIDALMDAYFDKPRTPAEIAAGASCGSLYKAIEDAASCMGIELQTKFKNDIGDYAYDIERKALRYGLYTGFKAERELFTGISQ